MIGLGIVALSLISAQAAPEVEPLKKCPSGAKLRGKAPPRGTAQWCEASDLFGKMQKNGPFLTWHENGRIRSMGYFVDGERHGDWKQWDESGRLLRQQSYRFGQAVGASTRQGCETTFGLLHLVLKIINEDSTNPARDDGLHDTL